MMPYCNDALMYLQELQEDGAIKHLGLTNFDTKHMNGIYDQGVKIVSNQVSQCEPEREIGSTYLPTCLPWSCFYVSGDIHTYHGSDLCMRCWFTSIHRFNIVSWIKGQELEWVLRRKREGSNC